QNRSGCASYCLIPTTAKKKSAAKKPRAFSPPACDIAASRYCRLKNFCLPHCAAFVQGFPPPLWGRDREGGVSRRTLQFSAATCTTPSKISQDLVILETLGLANHASRAVSTDWLEAK